MVGVLGMAPVADAKTRKLPKSNHGVQLQGLNIVQVVCEKRTDPFFYYIIVSPKCHLRPELEYWFAAHLRDPSGPPLASVSLLGLKIPQLETCPELADAFVLFE